MALGQLIVRLGLDAAEFVDGMTKSEYAASKFVKNTTATVTRLAGVYTAIAGAAAGAVAGMNAIVNNVAAYKDLADIMGSTAENVASLQRAADLSSTSMDTVASSSARLTSLMADISGTGKDAAGALKAIGINVDEFRKLDPALQFEQIAMALGNFEDGAGKTAVAIEIFGRAGAQLLPMLQDLYEEGGRNVILTQKQIEEADKFSRKYAEVESILRTTAQTIATNSLPAFQALLDHIANTITSASDLGASHAIEDFAFGSAKALAIMVESIGVVLKGIRALGGSFEVVWADLMVVSTFINNGGVMGLLFEKNRKELNAQVEKRNKTIEETVDRYADLWNEPVDRMSKAIQSAWDTAKQMRNEGVPLPRVDDWNFNMRSMLKFEAPKGGEKTEAEKAAEKAAAAAKAAAERARTSAENYIKSLERAEEAAADLTHYEQLMWDQSKGRLGSMTKAEFEHAVAIAKSIDATKAATEAERTRADQAKKDAADVALVIGDLTAATEAGERANKALAAAWLQQAQSIEDARDPLGKFIRDLEQIDKLVKGGFLSPEQAQRVKDALGDPTAAAEEDLGAMAKYAENAAKMMQETMRDFLFDPFADGTDEMFKNFSNAVQKMLAEATTAYLMEKLFGDFGKTGKPGGIIGNWWKGVYSGTGPVTTPADSGIPQMATGTNYVPYNGMPAILHKGEAVVPRAYNPAAGGAGASGISVSINMPANSAQSNISPMEYQRMVRFAVADGVVEAQRRGARL